MTCDNTTVQEDKLLTSIEEAIGDFNHVLEVVERLDALVTKLKERNNELEEQIEKLQEKYGTQ